MNVALSGWRVNMNLVNQVEGGGEDKKWIDAEMIRLTAADVGERNFPGRDHSRRRWEAARRREKSLAADAIRLSGAHTRTHSIRVDCIFMANAHWGRYCAIELVTMPKIGSISAANLIASPLFFLSVTPSVTPIAGLLASFLSTRWPSFVQGFLLLPQLSIGMLI